MSTKKNGEFAKLSISTNFRETTCEPTPPMLSTMLKKSRRRVADAIVTSVPLPPLAFRKTMHATTRGMFVCKDGNRITTCENAILSYSPSGRVSLVAGSLEDSGATDHINPTRARFFQPGGLVVDEHNTIYVADTGNNCIRTIKSWGEVNLFAGDYEYGHLDGVTDEALFNHPKNIVMGTDQVFFVTDSGNNMIRSILGDGTVSTFAGNCQCGFRNAKGGEARFDNPTGLAVDLDGSLLVCDQNNFCIRRVSMDGVVTSVTGMSSGNTAPQSTFIDGRVEIARFVCPTSIAVDAKGTIIVVDMFRIRIIENGFVRTISGCDRETTIDGFGRDACFREMTCMALDERGRLLINEAPTKNEEFRLKMRVIEAGLDSPAWMGPDNILHNKEDDCAEAGPAVDTIALEDYGSIADMEEFSDIELVVEGKVYKTHRIVLMARSTYFRKMFEFDPRRTRFDILGVSIDAMDMVLNFIYRAQTGDWDEMSKEQHTEKLHATLIAADMMALDGLLDACMEEYEATLTTSNAVEELIWSNGSGIFLFKKIAMSFFVRNCKRVESSKLARLKELDAETNQILMELIIKRM